MAESPPSTNAALWLENHILRAVSAHATNAHANFPAANLLSPHRSASWQSTTLGNVGVYFDLGSVVAPECLGIIDPNFSAGSSIQLVGSDDLAATQNLVAWTLPLYPVDPVGGVLGWYLGTPNSGTLGSGRQFWRVNLLETSFGPYNPVNADGEAVGYYEIGAVWIGTYEPIIIANADQSPDNPSQRSLAYGGAKWSDPLRTYEEIAVDLTFLTFAEYHSLRRKLKAHGEKYAVLDLHAGSDDDEVRAGGIYYGSLAQRPYRGRLVSPNGNTLSLDFEESRG